MRKLLSFIVVVLFLSCNHNPNFKFKSLEDFEDDMYAIKEGAKIKILSFSGGPACTDKETYYYQFIGIYKETNDTVRILSPCQTITDENPPEEGSFSPWDKTSRIIDSASKQFGLDKIEGDNTDKLVVFNRKNLDLEERPFKTAIGTLGF